MGKHSPLFALLAAVLLSSVGCRDGERNPLGSGDEAGGYSSMLESPYAQWPNGPSSDPGFFPIGVWLQDPANAARYRAAGINLYVGLWKGPTEEQLALLSEAGVQVICAQNEVGLAHLQDPTIVGWMHGDEPDNAQRRPDGSWGGPVPVEEILAAYRRMKANDPTRPVWLNLGQGVANDEWVGRAAPYEDYPRYIEGTDIVSFDVYPVAGIRKPDGEKYLWYVARGVDRLRAWSNFEKPVWNVIETTRINHPDKKATPQQVEAEVWMSLIHGSQGIVYFAHEWQPVFSEARLLEDAEMLAAVTGINAQIRRLAPVLNSPTLEGKVEVSSSAEEIPIDLLVKSYGGDVYIFAVPMRMGETRGRFEVKEWKGTAEVEVLGEDRTLEMVDGRFEDDFGAYEVHRYRIPDRSE